MNPLIPQLKANKFFADYLTKAHDFLKIESYSQVIDPQVEKYVK